MAAGVFFAFMSSFFDSGCIRSRSAPRLAPSDPSSRNKLLNGTLGGIASTTDPLFTIIGSDLANPTRDRYYFQNAVSSYLFNTND